MPAEVDGFKAGVACQFGDLGFGSDMVDCQGFAVAAPHLQHGVVGPKLQQLKRDLVCAGCFLCRDARNDLAQQARRLASLFGYEKRFTHSTTPEAAPSGTRSLNPDGNAQEGRRNRGGVLVRSFVLTVEQSFEFLLQIGGQTVFLRSFKCVHGWPVVRSEGADEL